MFTTALFALALPFDAPDLQVAYAEDVFPAGSPVTLVVSGEPGTWGTIGFDPVPGPVAIPGLGTLGLGLSADLWLLGFGPLDGSGTLTLDCAVACDSPIVGQPLYTQAVGVSPSTGALSLSNVDALVVEGTCAGCTPGYWKNHLSAWEGTGFDPDQDFDDVFGVELFGDGVGLLDALNAGGGGAEALGRHAVAALLSSATAAVGYPMDPSAVIDYVACGVMDGTLEKTKNFLAGVNESGCPL